MSVHPHPAPVANDPQDVTVNYSYLPDLLGHLLGLAHLQVTELCTTIMAPLALTPKQFVTLEFVANNPTISQKNIAHHVGVTPTVMVSILDELSKRKLVERNRSPHDRRCHFIQVTKKGRAMLAEIRDKAFEVETRFAEETRLTAEERAVMVRILRKMTKRE